MNDRRFDLVVYGASGFAGRLVAEYLAERHPDLAGRWAIAGRNPEKLKAVRDEIAATYPAAASAEIVVADSGDPASLDAMAASTRVVATTVGPYVEYGEPLVAACVRTGTAYCDLTGEVPWMRQMIDTYDADAKASGARIVHGCGFDSIPSDAGVYFLQKALIDRDGVPAEVVRVFVVGAKGGVSGGTVASFANALEQVRDPEFRRVLGHAYALNPEGERKGPDRGDAMGPGRDPVTGWWTGPFVMAAVNSRVVRRTNALLGYPYGREFRYDEVIKMGSGPAGMARAYGFSAAFGGFLGLMLVPPARALMRRFVLPDPGEGPSRESIDSGYFKLVVSGRRAEEEVGRATVVGRRDPGYGATACMLAESALGLVETAASNPGGGVLTPIAALGDRLLERLNAQDVTFELVDS